MSTSNDTSNISYGYCHCGCGQKTTIAKQNNASKNWVKGKPKRFILNHNLRLKKSTDKRFWSKVAITANSDMCWEWQAGHFRDGYGNFDGKAAHRASWEFTNGGIPDTLWVLHKCDNRSCVNPSHLFLGTQTDNMQDMVAKGRQRSGYLSGEKHPFHKLTLAQVKAIRDRYASGGVTQTKLAKEYGVSTPSINGIIRHLYWK